MIIAIGIANVVFALDSIPAIFGLTTHTYIVFTANAFALMGLRQLFFLVGGLLDRIVYLTSGLSVILGFIGAKLVVEALEGDTRRAHRVVAAAAHRDPVLPRVHRRHVGRDDRRQPAAVRP